MAVLRVGDRGPEVRRLQRALNRHLPPQHDIGVDGEFGPQTREAVATFQRSHGLAPDGVVTSDVWRALGVDVPTSARTTIGSDSTGRRTGPTRPAPIRRNWMEIAIAEIGVREDRDPGEHNSRIVEYHRTTSLRASDDETPWCASFVNWVLLQAGYEGTNSARARDWLEWGQPLVEPREGAVVVLKQVGRARHDASTGSHSGWHVAFFAEASPGHIRLLGGNQSNQVKYTTYSLERYEVKGYRWPG